MAVLETNNLTKKFGKVIALDNLNLSVNEGEVFGFIGPNGAGKTTTIRTLLGIIKATSGSASVFGLDAWRDAVEIHKRVAYVPGDVSLWSNLTGGEIIDLFVNLRGMKNDSRREKLVEMFDLDTSKKCRTYSKGNRQKVALVAAFAADADLYILDEPTSGLDPLMEKIFQECVEERKKEGKCIFLSSHILSEVEKLCDHVGIIRQGHLIETGTLRELRYLTRVNITVEAAKPITGLDKMSSVYNLHTNGKSVSFQLDANEMPLIIEYIGQFGVTRLECIPPTLEDLFMSHYTGDGGGK